MTRLIDLMCSQHRQQILDTRIWPFDQNMPGCGRCATSEPATVFPGISATEEMAVHEAGHAVIYLADRIRVACVDIGGNDSFAAYTNTEVHAQNALPGLTGLWAGAAAVRLWLDRTGLLDAAAEVDVAMSSRTDTTTITTMAGDIDLALEARDRADRMVKTHQAGIDRVAETLLVRRRLSGDEVAELAWLDARCRA